MVIRRTDFDVLWSIQERVPIRGIPGVQQRKAIVVLGSDDLHRAVLMSRQPKTSDQ